MTRARLLPSLREMVLAAGVFIAAAGAAHAEQVPLPTIDYEARATLLNDGSLFIRHTRGKMRIEMEVPQFKTPATGFIDLDNKRMVFMLPIPGVQDTAVEMEFGNDAAFGQVVGEGERQGQATVAGESCTLWKVSSPGLDSHAIACLTQDNIALRTQVTIDGKTRTVFEVTELKRKPQNPADFVPPSNLRVIKLPKGVKGIPGFPL